MGTRIPKGEKVLTLIVLTRGFLKSHCTESDHSRELDVVSIPFTYDELVQSALKPPVTNVLPSKFYRQQKVTIQTSSTGMYAR